MFFQLSFHFCRSKVLDNKNEENQPLFMSFGRKDFYWGVRTCMHVSVFWVRSVMVTVQQVWAEPRLSPCPAALLRPLLAEHA